MANKQADIQKIVKVEKVADIKIENPPESPFEKGELNSDKEKRDFEYDHFIITMRNNKPSRIYFDKRGDEVKVEVI